MLSAPAIAIHNADTSTPLNSNQARESAAVLLEAAVERDRWGVAKVTSGPGRRRARRVWRLSSRRLTNPG